MRGTSCGCNIDVASPSADDLEVMEPWIHSNARKLLGRVPWTARVVIRDGLQCTICTLGW
jgi:hypothetical protein